MLSPSRFRFGFMFCAVALLALTQTGCLINVGGTKVIDESAPRMAVEFESEQGMAAFVQHVRHRYPAEKSQGGGHFGIPFIIGVSETRVLSENAHYNAVVDKVDLNQDGTVSDAELRAAEILKTYEEKPTI